MHVGYLINQYPALSHSFIRREIRALERIGVTVSRISLRAVVADLIEPSDSAEAKLTTSILGQGWRDLASALARTIVARPRLATSALSTAWRMTRGGQRRAVRTIACWVEACWLSRRLLQSRVDHLHAHFGTNSAAVARLAARLSAIPYSFTIHGPEEFDNVDALDLRGKIEDASFTVAVSDFGRSQICRIVPMGMWSRIHVVRCGLDIVSGDANSDIDAEGDVDVCFVGRLAPQKGVPTLIEAIAGLQKRGVRVRTVIVGSGELSGEFQNYCSAIGVAELVTFTGPRSGAEVATAMRGAKIVVVPSFAEGLPVVIMEAFAAGIPVIATYIAGIPELVDEECGKLVVAGDPAGLAGAIEAVLGMSREERRAMGAVGQKRVASLHDIDRNARQLKALFEQYSGSSR